PSGDGPDEASYVRARALIGFAMRELELSGDVDAALSRLAVAARWARSAGSDALEVAVLGQLGLARLRTGDSSGALTVLGSAVARLDSAEPVDACRILLNWGSLLFELAWLDAARADL